MIEFIQKVVSRPQAYFSEIPDDAVAEWARRRINAKYIAAQEEGRV